MADEQEIIQQAEPEAPESRREALVAMFDKVESGEPIANDRPRDEQGKFAPKPEKVEKVAAPVAAATPEVAPVVEAPKPSLTTWRKEYLPLQEKLAKGEVLNPDEAKKLAEYNVERERQYSAGVATFKGEAAQAKEYTAAMAEFLPVLQQHNINPAQWIQNLGRAHATLALGSPEQKIAMFTRLAREYQIPMGAVAQAQNGQLDPVTVQLMQEIQNLKQTVSTVNKRWETQDQQEMQKEVSKFADAAKYPHFDKVVERMAQLLETGMSPNPDEAYNHAVWTDPELRALEMQRLAQPQTPAANVHKAAVVKAKAASGQVRSAAPRSTPTQSNATKDRRSALAEAFAAADNGHI